MSNLLHLLDVIDNPIPFTLGKLTTYLNIHAYCVARKKINIFDNFDNILIDSIVLMKLLKLFHIGNHRHMNIHLVAPIIFKQAISEGNSFYFLGGEEENISSSISVLKDSYPMIKICGYRNGYFTTFQEKEKFIQGILELNPDIIFCGMGTPLQETTLLEIRKNGWLGYGLSCGAYLNQIAEGIEYFPSIYAKYNIRWLYRAIKEPELIPRHIKSVLSFLVFFIYDFIRYSCIKEKTDENK
jgi:exopolysaccharide biosynthesis WecB/TagA/CpsF family protein